MLYNLSDQKIDITALENELKQKFPGKVERVKLLDTKQIKVIGNLSENEFGNFFSSFKGGINKMETTETTETTEQKETTKQKVELSDKSVKLFQEATNAELQAIDSLIEEKMQKKLSVLEVESKLSTLKEDYKNLSSALSELKETAIKHKSSIDSISQSLDPSALKQAKEFFALLDNFTQKK